MMTLTQWYQAAAFLGVGDFAELIIGSTLGGTDTRSKAFVPRGEHRAPPLSKRCAMVVQEGVHCRCCRRNLGTVDKAGDSATAKAQLLSITG